MAKTQTTAKPVPRANIPIVYVQYRSCCFLLTAIYGRFALSPIYLSLWIAYLLAAPWVLRANLVFCFYIRARERSVWKIRCEFALLCSGKSVNLKLAHKIKLSWINLQHFPLGDILNDVLQDIPVFSRTCCSAAYWKLWPEGFLLPYPNPPPITPLDYCLLLSQSKLCFDELLTELLEDETFQESRPFLLNSEAEQLPRQRNGFPSRSPFTSASASHRPLGMLWEHFLMKWTLRHTPIKWQQFFMVGY